MSTRAEKLFATEPAAFKNVQAKQTFPKLTSPLRQQPYERENKNI